MRQLTIAMTLAGIMLLTLLGLGVARSNRDATSSPTADSDLAQPGPAGLNALMFIENVGQSADPVRFYLKNGQTTVYLTEEALWFSHLNHSQTDLNRLERRLEARQGRGRVSGLPAFDLEDQPIGVNLKFTFPKANPAPRLEGFNRLDTRLSLFMGSDPSQWHANVPVWGGVRYVDLYPGFDLEISSDRGRWRWRLVSNRPETTAKLPAETQLHIEGAQSLAADKQKLLLTTELGPFALPLLQAVTADGASLPLQTNAATVEGATIVFPFMSQDNALDSAGPELISGVEDLIYSTYLGGSNKDDFGLGVEVNSIGEAYLTGSTAAADFPGTTGVFTETFNGIFDAFIFKLNATGTAPVFATYLGGAGRDLGMDIELDALGNIYVAGRTNSTDFPTTAGAWQTTNKGKFDAFVTKFNPTGDALVHSTYLGGSEYDNLIDFDLDVDNNAYLTGETQSADFPTFLSFQGFGGQADAYITKLSPTGDGLVYSSFLGGSEIDQGLGLALDSAGNAYLAGQTSSNDFPVTVDAYDSSYNGNGDAFIAKIGSTGTILAYATYIGGSNYDDAIGIAADDEGNAFVMGEASENFPVTLGAFDASYNGQGDAFGLVLDTTVAGAAGLQYASFIGGSADDWGYDVKADLEERRFFVMGYTQSANFPVTVDAFDKTQAGGTCGAATDPYPCGDAFVIEFTSDVCSLNRLGQLYLLRRRR